MSLHKAILLSLLPPGPLWVPEEGEGFDILLDGLAECMDTVCDDINLLAYARDPLHTSLLDDLEREYGVIPRGGDIESIRRARLAAAKAGVRTDGSLTTLQRILQAAGFNVQIHANNPPVNPANFIFSSPAGIFGNNAALFGASIFGAQQGEMLVNGPTYYQQQRVNYAAAPLPAGYWPLVFFVAGNAARNQAGEITAMQDAEVPVERKAELATLILKYKPLHSWAGLRIQYVQGEV